MSARDDRDPSEDDGERHGRPPRMNVVGIILPSLAGGLLLGLLLLTGGFGVATALLAGWLGGIALMVLIPAVVLAARG